MPKLYWSADHPGLWIAFSRAEGWLQFPARDGGWHQRTLATGLNPAILCELPPYRAYGTEFPGSREFYSRTRLVSAPDTLTAVPVV